MKKIIATFLSLTTVFTMGLALVGPLQVNAETATSALGMEFGTELGLGNQDIRVTVARIIKTVMGLLGIVAVVIVLVGGFKWMTAGGNEEQVGEAKKWLFSGVIGMAIIFSAWALTNFIVNSLVSATGYKAP